MNNSDQTDAQVATAPWTELFEAMAGFSDTTFRLHLIMPALLFETITVPVVIHRFTVATPQTLVFI